MNDQTALRTTAAGSSKIVLSSQLLLSELKVFLAWWYVEMPVRYLSFIKRVLVLCDDTLSIQLLLKTFFVPWHRDYSPIGRAFGVAMRILYLPVAISMTAIVAIVLMAVTVLWALLPVISILSILRTPFL